MPPRAVLHSLAHDLVNARAIASAKRTAISSTSDCVLLAIGCSRTTVGWSGMPSILALITAAVVKASVSSVTAGVPRFSNSIVSWRPHDMQDPQSATP